MVLEGQGCRPFPSVLSLSRRMETPSRLINHGLRSCVYLQHVSHNDTRRINTKTICTSLKSAPPFTTLKISCFFGCRQLSHKKKLVCPPPPAKKRKRERDAPGVLSKSARCPRLAARNEFSPQPFEISSNIIHHWTLLWRALTLHSRVSKDPLHL